jgi:hypothetical protein
MNISATDVSEEYIASIFKVEEYAKEETNVKQVVSSTVRDGGERSHPAFVLANLSLNFLHIHVHCDAAISAWLHSSDSR